MSLSIMSFRRCTRWLSPLVGLVLTIGLLAIGIHQHHGDSTSHICAVCTAAYSTSMETGPLPVLGVPPSLSRRLAAPIPTTPRSIAAAVPRGRAPPLA